MAELDNIASQLLKSASEADKNYAKTRDQSQRDRAVRLRRIVENLKNIVLGASDLNGLSDVTISAPANAQVLTYNSTTGQWENQTPAAGGGGNMNTSTYDVDNDGIVDGSETTQIIVRNSTGATLTKGQVVYLSGATGNRPNALLSQANTEATSSKTIGIVIANIANNADGYVAVNGTLHDLDTSAFTAGDAVWLSATTAGAYTSTIPAEPNHTVFIGYVARSHPTQGRLVILIQNGYELNELHGVLISSEANNDLLVYETSSTLWKNKSISTIFGGTPLVSVPTLAQVTTAGNTTTNAITVGGLAAIGSTNTAGIVNITNNFSGTYPNAVNILFPNISSSSVQAAGFYIGKALSVNNGWGVNYIHSADGSSSNRGSIAFYGTDNIINWFANGNVSINSTTNAGFKLDVNGTARVQGNLTIPTEAYILRAGSTAGSIQLTTNEVRLRGTVSTDGSAVIGTIAGATLAKFEVNGSITAASAIARGVYFNNTLVAAANNDVLVGLDINPTFTNGAFTGVQNMGLRVNSQDGSVAARFVSTSGSLYIVPRLSSVYGTYIGTHNSTQTAQIPLSLSANRFIFDNGNVLIGTTTDAGYKLDVNGTARVKTDLKIETGTGGLTIEGDASGYPTLSINTLRSGVDRRNWKFATEQVTAGDFIFYRSSTGGGAANTVVYAVSKDGNFGLGTPTPSYPFHISSAAAANIFGTVQSTNANGTAAWVAFNDQSDNVVYRVFGSGASGTQMGIALARTASLIANLGGSGKFLIGTYSGTDLVFGTSDTARMRLVDSTGNFLVGTMTDLGNKLEVSGTINSTGYKINNVIGYTGILNIMMNPPGMQNIDIQSGIIVNIF